MSLTLSIPLVAATSKGDPGFQEADTLVVHIPKLLRKVKSSSVKKAAPSLFVGGLLLFGTVHVYAQKSSSVLLVADRILDVERGTMIEKRAILEIDGVITQIAPFESIQRPANVTVITFPEGTTLLPGLIDAHTHLLQSFDPKLGGDDPNQVLAVALLGTTQRVLQGAKNAREDLLAGITTVRDVGNSGVGGDVALRNAIQKSWVVGPRMLVSTRALSAAGGQFPSLAPEAQNLVSMEYVAISGPQQARQATRQAIYDGADLIKVIVDTFPRGLDVDEMKAVVEEAHRVGKKVAAHAITEIAIQSAIDAGVDSIEHGYEISNASLMQMARAHIFLVPTDYLANSPLFDGFTVSTVFKKEFENRSQQRLRKAIALGVPLAFGSDEYYDLEGLSRGQASLLPLEAYLKAGMSAISLLQMTTLSSARLLGIDKEVGSLSVGKRADIIAVPGDVLVDPLLLRHVTFVMQGGEVRKAVPPPTLPIPSGEQH